MTMPKIKMTLWCQCKCHSVIVLSLNDLVWCQCITVLNQNDLILCMCETSSVVHVGGSGGNVKVSELKYLEIKLHLTTRAKIN